MGSRRDGKGYLFQVQVHANGVADRQNESRSNASGRADGAEYPSRASSLILGRRRARASFSPTPGDLVLLADPGFILEPNFYVRICRQSIPDFRHTGGKVFLNVSPAWGS